MLTVTILMVGKTRESFIREGLSFYEKRLQPFLHLTLKNVREEKEAGGLSAETIRAREGERLRAQISAPGLRDRPHPGRPGIHHGGIRRLAQPAGRLGIPAPGLSHRRPLGLDPATVLAAADERLALSRLTLTHELARLSSWNSSTGP